MDIQLTQDVQSKLTSLAELRGLSNSELVSEAIERMAIHDDWFIAEVEEGLAAADRGEFVEHDAVKALLQDRYSS